MPACGCTAHRPGALPRRSPLPPGLTNSTAHRAKTEGLRSAAYWRAIPGRQSGSYFAQSRVLTQTALSRDLVSAGKPQCLARRSARLPGLAESGGSGSPCPARCSCLDFKHRRKDPPPLWMNLAGSPCGHNSTGASAPDRGTAGRCRRGSRRAGPAPLPGPPPSAGSAMPAPAGRRRRRRWRRRAVGSRPY